MSDANKRAQEDMNAELHRLLGVEDRPMQHAGEVWRLYKRGLKADIADSDGMLPLLRVLSWAVDAAESPTDYQEACSIIRALLRAHADLNATTPEGATATDLARQWSDNGTVVDMLRREACRRADPVLKMRVQEIHLDWPAPNAPADRAVQDFFFEACRQGNFQPALYVLRTFKDAAIWTDPDHDLPMSGLVSALVSNDNTTLIYHLIAEGSDINFRSGDGMTPLMLAAAHGRSVNIVEYLLEAGADPTLVNERGATALDIAQANGNAGTITLLTEAIARLAADRAAAQAAQQNAQTQLNTRLLSDARRKGLRL